MIDSAAFARLLIEGGAGRSARVVLGEARGFEANELRTAADRVTLAREIYGLGVLPGGRGIAVPLRVTFGAPRANDADHRRAMMRALDFARSWCGSPELPDVRIEAEDVLAPFGDSLALGAALAFLCFYTGASPRGPVLVTGALAAHGGVLAVDAMDAKIEAARGERCAPNDEPIVLVPPGVGHGRERTVASLADAMLVIFENPTRQPRPELLSCDRLIDRSRHMPDHAAAAEMLGSIDRARIPDADRVRVLFELGTRLRHHGRSEEAARMHTEARANLAAHARALGASEAERYEVEALATMIDAFAIDEAIRASRSRLERPFLDWHNEVRTRGALAQALAMRGHLAESIELRRANLDVQGATEAMRRELPWTLCALTLDAARAGDVSAFESYARRLVAATHPGDSSQWRYNSAALVRGLVALGRSADALEWASGAARLFDTVAPEALRSLWHEGSTLQHPEVSVVRALMRAWRRTGSPKRAIALAQRVTAPENGADNLVAWLAEIARLEASLAHDDLGDSAHARAVARSARERMTQWHATATAFHDGIREAAGPSLERVIDSIWY